ncbi:ATP-dependent RNA helicase [Skeletonema marinoi]|uniref:ATP-dependent RNA helicase n=1 Tax=Skeletonema marinoi TaxID=267567 RepID=A0AAD9D4Q8_9STRA|nr:ATP-dependent RNA helicase [Skeletonema marinoi]
MSTKIKGGGRAILSKESQQSLIDLLFSLETAHDDNDGRTSSSLSEASKHDRKQLQKKFVKKLVRRHERRVLREQFNVDGRGERAVKDDKAERSRDVSAGLSDMSSLSTAATAAASGGNVRIELAEAIFTSTNDKSSKKKSSKKDTKKDKDKSTTKKKKDNNEDLFKIGTKKVVVLPRSTSITNLLKQSKSKLKLKKNPVRAFVQTDSGGGDALFDLEHDLSGVVDGTVVYVTLTPRASNDEDESTKDKDDNDEDNDTDDNTDALLDSIKLAYKKQQSHRNLLHQSRQQQLQRVHEVIDTMKQQIQLESRQRLPVAAYKQQILDIIHQNQVVVLSGATGSGKSTQIPQFLLESHQGDNHQRRPYIIVTQPRRVAATSLAQRVAQERGCPPPGQSGSSIGYMVRSDRRVDFRCCRVIYMTIGVLLRILLNSESRVGETEESTCDDNGNGDSVQPLTLESISHLVIDETHERDVNTDFTLTLLKGMMISAAKKSSHANVKQLPRLILMSATASSELFVNYFTLPATRPATIDIPGRTFPVETNWLAECEKLTGKTMARFGGGGTAVEGLESDGISSPRAIEKIDDVFIRSLIVKIVEKQQNEGQLNDSSDTEYRKTGAILVFLPGLGEIESLARCLYDKGTIAGNRAVCNILELHSTIPKSDQGRVFEPAVKGTVKIILSTNIAETSLTIEDVSYVIDTCRVKESRYQSSSRIKELVTVWTSHAAMKQRTGRAGRTSNGTCYRLCLEEFARDNLLPQTSPEMVRTPLDELILQVCLLYEQRRDEVNARLKSSGGENKSAFPPGANPLKFLSMTPTPPQEQSLVQSCRHLLEVDALKVVNYGDTEVESDLLYRLTPIGYHCSRLPMDAKLAKTLIVGCILGVLDNALIIAASLSCTKSCFVSGRQLDPIAVEARDSLIENGFGGRDWPGGTVKSDMIAVIAVYRAWTQQKDKKEKFCRNHALNYLALREIDTLRRQFLDLVIDAGLASRDDLDDCNMAKQDALITSCCLVASLYPNICTLVRPRKGGPKGGRLLTKDGDISRPSSSSFQRKRVNAAAENGKDAYAIYHAKHRTIGAVGVGGQRQRPPETFLPEVNFVSKFSLLLFGGQLELVKNAIIIDGWLKFKVSDDSESRKGSAIDNAVLILSLRDALDKVIIEHVVETFASSEEKSTMMKRHKGIIEVVRQILSEEGS